MLRANSKEELREVIFQYRLRNNIPIGNIEADIDKWYCDRWPGFCIPDDTDTSTFDEPLLNKISRWAAEKAKHMPVGGYELTIPAEAEKRAEVCVKCIYNKPWKGLCGGCSASTLQLLQQIKKTRRTKKDGNLSACTLAVWDNSVAVHLGVKDLPVSDDVKAKMPEGCWRKQM